MRLANDPETPTIEDDLLIQKALARERRLRFTYPDEPTHSLRAVLTHEACVPTSSGCTASPLRRSSSRLSAIGLAFGVMVFLRTKRRMR